jgi:signal transduction histidine kinase
MAAPDQDQRLTAALRLVVAVAALAIFALDPSEHPSRRPFALAALAAFAIYGGAAYLLALRRGRSLPMSIAPWIDAAWVTLAVAVSQGTSGIFYPLYLFAIVCASFWGGRRRGLSVAVASAAAFAALGALTAPAGVDLRHFLFSSLYLLVLGYLIATWGGHEVGARARLRLLRDVTSLSSPRFGVEATVGRILEAVRAFFDADSCRLVVADDLSRQHWTRVAARGREVDAATVLPPELAAILLPQGADAALLARRERRGGVVAAALGDSGPPRAWDPAAASALLTTLEAGALLSVPFRYHANAAGRLYVARDGSREFDRSDAEFLRHVLDQVVPVLENLRLVDHLAADAADEERRRIALDLHDSVIQPYLGLRLGLSAARTALAAGRVPEASAHVDRLVQLADDEIGTLRGYVRELRAAPGVDGTGLEASVRRFCRRFGEATGIRVEVAVSGAPPPEPLAAEAFQMIAEALANVRKHTEATRAEIRISAAAPALVLAVANDGARPGPAAFFPRSLAERAAMLGGHVEVGQPRPGTTEVRVEIPLSRGGVG